MKKVFNVGGNNKLIALPPHYAEFEHFLLDIDPAGSPEIVCDARELTTLQSGQFDAVYCAHNLEHYYRHDVPRVLAGFLHVLKNGGFAQIRVPDLHEVMKVALERALDLEDVLYESDLGPITVLDVLYGHGEQIARSGQDFFAHKTGFTNKSLLAVLHAAGFSKVFSRTGMMEIDALAFKGAPDEATRAPARPLRPNRQ